MPSCRCASEAPRSVVPRDRFDGGRQAPACGSVRGPSVRGRPQRPRAQCARAPVCAGGRRRGPGPLFLLVGPAPHEYKRRGNRPTSSTFGVRCRRTTDPAGFRSKFGVSRKRTTSSSRNTSDVFAWRRSDRGNRFAATSRLHQNPSVSGRVAGKLDGLDGRREGRQAFLGVGDEHPRLRV